MDVRAFPMGLKIRTCVSYPLPERIRQGEDTIHVVESCIRFIVGVLKPSRSDEVYRSLDDSGLSIRSESFDCSVTTTKVLEGLDFFIA